MTVRVSDTSSEEECVPKTLYTPPGHVDDKVKSSDEDWMPATPDPSGARPRKPRATGKLSQSLMSKYFDIEVGGHEVDDTVHECQDNDPPPNQMSSQLLNLSTPMFSK